MQSSFPIFDAGVTVEMEALGRGASTSGETFPRSDMITQNHHRSCDVIRAPPDGCPSYRRVGPPAVKPAGYGWPPETCWTGGRVGGAQCKPVFEIKSLVCALVGCSLLMSALLFEHIEHFKM